jgi:hypothetical protein
LPSPLNFGEFYDDTSSEMASILCETIESSDDVKDDL